MEEVDDGEDGRPKWPIWRQESLRLALARNLEELRRSTLQLRTHGQVRRVTEARGTSGDPR